MSNYLEFGNKIAFHPGYYIKEYIDELGLTQEDFANRLGTTPKNISYIVRGGQSISVDIANKLSRLIGTSVQYWLNLQTEYDSLIVRFNREKELDAEKEVFKYIKYSYFRDNFGLPDIPQKIDEQIKNVREFLHVSSLTVFKNRDMYVNFRRPALEQSEASMIRANIMVQIAINLSLIKKDFPKYDKNKFLQSVDYALSLTKKHNEFYGLIKKAFKESGVDLLVLPNMPGSKINGATKKLGDYIMLMVNDRNNNSDSFWFTLFHEIGHIINRDFGISFEKESGAVEEKANLYAENSLIPQVEYTRFVEANDFSIVKIKEFANSIDRDPSIVLGRLQKDGFIRYDDWKYNVLRTKYAIST